MSKLTFTHEELLNLKWLVENTDMLTDDMQQMLSLKLTKMLAGDGERLVLVSCNVRGGH